MTGYGRAEGEVSNRKFIVELKTLNSKQFDMLSRIPSVYKEKELIIRSILQQKLERGKIEITINVEDSKAEVNFIINRELAKQYYSEISELQKEIGLGFGNEILSTILKLPEVVQAVPDVLEEEEWEGIQKIIHQAVDLCNASRLKEGKALENDFTDRIASISDLLQNVNKYEDQRLVRIS